MLSSQTLYDRGGERVKQTAAFAVHGCVDSHCWERVGEQEVRHVIGHATLGSVETAVHEEKGANGEWRENHLQVFIETYKRPKC